MYSCSHSRSKQPSDRYGTAQLKLLSVKYVVHSLHEQENIRYVLVCTMVVEGVSIAHGEYSRLDKLAM